ncbi:MAG: DUF3883 domain-containing protein [Phycisphaerales bacterium]|nr:DUF3883 domain-containing protein [Phycisphaerales bacterium]
MESDSRLTDRLDEAFNDALVENTAQSVFNRLQELEDERDTVVERWIWELIQNARDAAGESGLNIRVERTADRVVFRHNGSPFRDKEIAHLIYHGSTKRLDSGIGRFGTGFVTTHLIARQIRVRGLLRDGRGFDFTLDRRALNSEELRIAMQASRDEFTKSLIPEGGSVVAPYTTEFEYPITAGVVDVVDRGLSSLLECIPLLLAFNPSLESITFERDGTDRTWTKTPTTSPIAHLTAYRVSSAAEVARTVVVTGDEDVQVALLLREEDGVQVIERMTGVPKLFLAFPLNGTADLCVPLVANSEAFIPRKERDGIVLGASKSSANETNQRLFQNACGQIADLVRDAAAAELPGAPSLAFIGAYRDRQWIDEEWFRKTITQGIVSPLRKSPIVLTVCGATREPTKSWIPIGKGSASALEVWETAQFLGEGQTHLPIRADVVQWTANLESWASIQSASVDEFCEALTIRQLVDRVAGLGTIAALKAELEERQEPVAWLNRLYGLLVKAGMVGVLHECSLVPNQAGELSCCDELRLDTGVDEALKDIAGMFGIDIRRVLAAPGVEVDEVLEMLDVCDEDEVLRQALNALGEHVEDDELKASLVEANLALMQWLLARDKVSELDGFPAITSKAVNGTVTVATLKRTTAAHQRPLAPVSCWPEPARQYVDLFPEEYVLAEECRDDASAGAWEALSDAGMVHLSPLFECDGYVEEFLPDEPLSDDDKNIRSESQVERSEIAFLIGGERSVLDRVRSSRPRAVRLLKFVLEYVLAEDGRAFDEQVAACDNGSEHKYYRANWIGPIKKRPWIPVDKGRSPPGADVLGRLLRPEQAVLEQLSSESARQFLASIGVSPADLTLRAISDSEDERMTVIQSAATMVEAMGHDAAKFEAFARDVHADPGIFEVVEQRRQRRECVERNRKLGKLVEDRIRDALKDSGLRVERTGIGHDFTVRPQSGEEDDAIGLKISGANDVYLEVKGVTDEVARMSVRQVEAAVANADRYMLCVVEVVSDEPTEAEVAANARFLADIGGRLTTLWSEYEFMRDTIDEARSTSGPICMEISGHDTKVRIERTIWSAGVDLEAAVRLVVERAGGI